MPLGEKFPASSEARRWPLLGAAAGLTFAIAVADWKVEPHISLGLLYILAITLAAGSLRPWQVVVFSIVCAGLREAFSPFREYPGWPMRVVLVSLGFSGAGLLVWELTRNRRLMLQHLAERHEAEQQLRVLIETSPLAILTLDAAGKVLIANSSAHRLLGFEGEALAGQDIRAYLPVLALPLRDRQSLGGLHTTLECRGHRRDGEVFLAQVWCSTYQTASGPRLAAVVWDASESLRDREGAGLETSLATSRVVIGAVSHELRNLAAAAATAHGGLGSIPELEENKDYQALGALLQGLKAIASSGLRLAADRTASVADLASVLEEARIVIESAAREAGIAVSWQVPGDLPRVRGDHLSLLQVFLNLARNSQRALEEAARKDLAVEAFRDGETVTVRFRDTGAGVLAPERLFQPLQPGAEETGLGLYVSRAMLRAGGGDLRYEPQPEGACFVAELAVAAGAQERLA